MTQPAIDLLDLIGADTRLKKVANTRGGEYAGACPFCGGKDRMRVQPEKAQWWCRQCSPNEHWQSAADYVMRRDNVPFKEAMSRLGLSLPEPETWDYHDHEGTVIYQVVRVTRGGVKEYRQRTPAPSGDWVWKLNGTQPTIYRLPEVLRAAAAGESIYVTEGEKCADALRRLGLVATTNSGGAGKWRAHYSDYFQGARDVVILADNDPAGHRHAQEVLNFTHKVVPSARVVSFDELPIGGDVADWLALGHTKDDLMTRCIPRTTIDLTGGIEYVVGHPYQGITLAELQYKVFQPERWIIENIMPEGACLFAAKYKSKKSWLALAISLAIAMNGKALGRLSVSPGRVLYLDLEGKQQRIQKRTRAMLGVKQVDWPANFHIYTKWSQGDQALIDLEHWLVAHPDAAFVVIDVLASFRRPMEKHEMMYQYDRDTVDPINELAERYHVTIFLVHHFNKGKHDDIMDSITGSTGLPSAVNTMWGLRRDVNDSTIQVLELRGRDLENEDPLALKWDVYLNQHVIEGNAAEVATSAERRAVLGVLDDDEPRTPKDIAAELGKPVTAIQQLLRKLINDGLVDKVGYGKYAIIRRLDQTDQSDQSSHTDQSDQSSDSDRSAPTLIDPTNRSELRSEFGSRQNGVNPGSDANSDHSDRYNKGSDQFPDIFDTVPPAKRTILRLYLRSNKESDQERAQELCAEYGIDYNEARKATS